MRAPDRPQLQCSRNPPIRKDLAGFLISLEAPRAVSVGICRLTRFFYA